MEEILTLIVTHGFEISLATIGLAVVILASFKDRTDSETDNKVYDALIKVRDFIRGRRDSE